MNKNRLAQAAIAAVAGIVIMLVPMTMTVVIGFAVGITLLLAGIGGIVEFVNDKKNVLGLVLSVVCLVAGGWILFRPDQAIQLVPIAVGLYLIVTSIVAALTGQRGLVPAVIGAAAGVVCLMMPFGIAETGIRVCGFLMVVGAALELFGAKKDEA